VTLREKAVLLPLVAFIFILGLFPRPFLAKMEPSVKAFIADYHTKLALPDGPARIVGVGAAGGADDAAKQLDAAAGRVEDLARRLGDAAPQVKAGGQP